jgi:pyruvate dehydrogenase E2 component (dihydrolipoamide acetyltransferase)
MPKLSDSMEEGTILRWLKADGDAVAEGDELAEIETDKATQTYEAQAAGTLSIVAPEGSSHPVGAVIARLGEGAAAPVTAEAPAEAPAEPEPAGAPAPSPAEAASNGGPKASPVARRIAQQQGIDLATVKGTGPGGRITKADVDPSSVAAPPPPAPAAAPAPPVQRREHATAKGDVAEQEPTRTQQVIARRMAESKATIPDFAISAEVDMERCVDLRAQLKALGGEIVPSYNDMVVRACALALRDHPKANGSWRDGRFAFHSRVNVGVAVATEGALVVPTVFDADEKPLESIAAEVRALAAKVRAGQITPPEVSGGTFTVSNLGMFGVTEMEPVINPPQAAILGVGALVPRPVVRDGQVVVRHVATLTLVSDHRILYGAEAAGFLGRVRELLEQPVALAR